MEQPGTRLRRSLAAALPALGVLACGEVDRCLDAGGRWNDAARACEFASGPPATPRAAISAARRSLEFAYGRGVREQEPFRAELEASVWHVFGTPAQGAPGGVAQAWIELETGGIRRLAHGDSPAP